VAGRGLTDLACAFCVVRAPSHCAGLDVMAANVTCAVGDLSGRHGKLNLSLAAFDPTAPSTNRQMFVDKLLPLSGQLSVAQVSGSGSDDRDVGCTCACLSLWGLSPSWNRTSPACACVFVTVCSVPWWCIGLARAGCSRRRWRAPG
jgi:hypothetical protein